MTDRELMQMALDALESWQKTCLDCGRSSEELGRSTAPVKALRERLQRPCETGTQCIGGKCPECTSDDGDEMCETCDCWKKTRAMCS